MSGAWEGKQPGFLIGVLTTGLVTIDWALQFVHMQKPGTVHIRAWRGLPYDVARNRLVKDAREIGCSHLFFLDSDVLPPVDVIPRLMSQQLPIISGLYWSKKGTPGMWKSTLDRKTYEPIVEWPQGQLVEVDAVGAGCLLIDMRVFDTLDKMELPWFEWTIKDPADQEGRYSEDFVLCRHVQDAGYRVYVATGVVCRHEHNVAFNPTGTIEGIRAL